MIFDLDIYRAANTLIERYGERAELQAAKRHADMLVNDDTDGARMWSPIRSTIKSYRRRERARCIDGRDVAMRALVAALFDHCRLRLCQAPSEQRLAAQRGLLTEAFMYRMCVSHPDGFTWSECTNIRRSLDRHLAAFKATYAPGH